jgi:ABC-2 type transport system ATP-binding protein
MALAVEVRGLTKTYGGRFGRRQEALRGVDLRLDPGTAYGIIGPNGAGKTTFIKAILGIVRPSGGDVRLLGGDPADPARRARVGYLPERLVLPGAFDARGTMESVARLKGLGNPRRELGELLERVGLGGAGKRRVREYSKGMRQRLGLAAALIGQPELLVLDEPTDGLDPLARVEVRAILGGEVARGAAVLLNSHLLSETERVCDHVGVLVAGRMVREGPIDDLLVSRGGWRLRFERAGPEVLREAGLTPDADGTCAFDGDAEGLNQAIDAARAAGALLVEVVPRGDDLEQVLAEAVRRAS